MFLRNFSFRRNDTGLENDYIEHRKRVSQIEKKLTRERTSLKEIFPHEKILLLANQIENQAGTKIISSYSNIQFDINNLKNNINTQSAQKMLIFCESYYCHTPIDSLGL